LFRFFDKFLVFLAYISNPLLLITPCKWTVFIVFLTDVFGSVCITEHIRLIFVSAVYRDRRHCYFQCPSGL